MNNLSKYIAARDSIRTGDLLAFSGKGFTSRLIRFVTGSIYSHVGLAIVGDDSYMGKMVYIAEVTSLNTLPDILTGKRRKGLQIQFLSQRLFRYKGGATLFQLKKTIIRRRRTGFCRLNKKKA